MALKYIEHDKELLIRDVLAVVENWLHNSQLILNIRDILITDLEKYEVKLKKQNVKIQQKTKSSKTSS